MGLILLCILSEKSISSEELKELKIDTFFAWINRAFLKQVKLVAQRIFVILLSYLICPFIAVARSSRRRSNFDWADSRRTSPFNRRFHSGSIQLKITTLVIVNLSKFKIRLFVFFYKKWANPGLFLFIFGRFKQTIPILQ